VLNALCCDLHSKTSVIVSEAMPGMLSAGAEFSAYTAGFEVKCVFGYVTTIQQFD